MLIPYQIIWNFPETPIAILAAVLVAFIARIAFVLALRAWVRLAVKRSEERQRRINLKALQIIKAATNSDDSRNKARIKTVSSLLRSVLDLVLIVVLMLTILAILGIPMSPVLTSAGIGGVALAFGAQSLVKDYLSGIFMVFEDQYGVGDFVNLGGVSGTVEEVTLRITRIRDSSGQVWYLRNGDLLKVGNQSQGWATQAVDIPVDYREDPERVSEILSRVAAEFGADPQWDEVLIEPPALWGLSEVEGQTQRFQLGVKTAPTKQWAVSRALRAACLKALAAEGVAGPPVQINSVSTQK